MPILTLRERIASYESLADTRLIPKLPVITILNGRVFRKTTSLLKKPCDPIFVELMCATMIKLFYEVEGAAFIYSFNDEIILVSRNDQTLTTEPWYNNSAQKISAASAAIATLAFNSAAKKHNISLFGDAIFTASTFVVPNISEAINTLISKQNECFQVALYNACFFSLLPKVGPNETRKTLENKGPQAKAELLFDNFGIEFNNYPSPFTKGVAVYRKTQEEKAKIKIDLNLPSFSKEQDFLYNIFTIERNK